MTLDVHWPSPLAGEDASLRAIRPGPDRTSLPSATVARALLSRAPRVAPAPSDMNNVDQINESDGGCAGPLIRGLST